MPNFNETIESIKDFSDGPGTVLLLTKPSINYTIRKKLYEYAFENNGTFFHVDSDPLSIDNYTFNFSKNYVPAWWPHKETWWLSGKSLTVPGFIYFSNVEKMNKNIRDKVAEACISRQINGYALAENFKVILSIASENNEDFESSRNKIKSSLTFYETFKVLICGKYK